MKNLKCLVTCLGLAACATEPPPTTSATGTTNTDGWTDFQAHPPVTWDEFRASAHRQTFEPYPYIVDGDIALADEAALRHYYDAWLADAYASQSGDSALTVRNVLGADVLQPGGTRDALSYCVSDSFGAQKATVVAALGRATKSWSDQVGVRFVYRPGQDATCTNTNAKVLFNVSPSSSPDFFAASFFPDDARASRQLMITPSAFTTTSGGRDFEGILRHETGHILGFRHEHIHINCTGETTAESRAVTSYDVNSVMHYPQCRPSGTGGYRQTTLDYSGAVALYGAPRTTDILWRNVNTGAFTEWQMSPTGTVASTINLFTEPAEWQVQTIGDFNGDGAADVLWRNVSTGAFVEWLMKNGTVAATVTLFTEPAEWQVQGNGDFNGDGISDILWRNVNTGAFTEWLMNSSGNVGATASLFAQPVEWQVKGIGDFNNDGTSDILWRNTTTGAITEWLMANGAVGSTATLPAQPAALQIQGIGDFNGDGTSDVLWRNVTTGAFSEWLLSNGAIAATPTLFTEPAEWQVQRIGDFNGDGTSDVLWRNVNTGQITEWLMVNGGVGAAPNLFAEPAEWQVHGVGNFNG